MDRSKDIPATTDTAFAQRLLSALQEARTKIETFERFRSEPLAIVGMGCRFPGKIVDAESYWNVLHQGMDVITAVPKDRWDIDALYDSDPDVPGKMSTRYGGFLPDVAAFDAPFFGISRREAIGMDPQQRLLLEVCWEAIEHAGISPAGLRGTPAGVFMGIGTFDYAGLRYAQRDYEGVDSYFATGGVLSVAAGRLSYALGLTGPSMAVDTACSSSLVAVHLACQSLRSRECDLALAGGVNVILLPELSINFSRARMLSPDGRCKTFDASANGYVRGEGCGVIVLKRLSDATAAGDRILALVRGSAVNQDGPSGGLTVPSGPAQEAVIQRALSNSGVTANDVGYIEAHGTGTSLGDPIEVGALAKVFGDRPAADPLVIGSVKTNIGHLEAAAGIAGVMKVVLSLQKGEIPAHLHFKTPNPHIAWEQLPFEIPTGPRSWPKGRKRLAGVSAFGASGTNAHIVLEEGPAVEDRAGVGDQAGAGAGDPPCHLLALSARDEAALKTLAARYAAHISNHPEDAIEDICFTANTGRSHFEERLAVTGATGEEIAARCREYSEGRRVRVAQERPKAEMEGKEENAGNDRRRMIESLGEQYERGITPDWRGIDGGRGRNRVALPTYPFQRQRYWIRSPGTTPAVSRSFSGRNLHPLLGQRLPTAHRDLIFESQISPDSPPYLGDHRIYGEAVFPATGYVEMALAAGLELIGSGTLTIEDVSIQQPLILSRKAGQMMQTILHPETDGAYAFEIFSEAAPGRWRRHAAGKIRGDGEADGLRTERLEAIKPRCTKPLSVADHYRAFTEKGIAYGPGFQGIER
ncbi:MAG: beta-ketoacyl synthase N-terminal-like domain-containing protein, partial [Pseudomonadota bacterium]